MKLKIFKHFGYILTTALFLSVGTNLYASEIDPTDVRQTHPEFIIRVSPEEHAQAIGLEGMGEPIVRTTAGEERAEKIRAEIRAEVAATPPTEEELAETRRVMREAFEANLISVRTFKLIDPDDPSTHNTAREIAEFFGEEYIPNETPDSGNGNNNNRNNPNSNRDNVRNPNNRNNNNNNRDNQNSNRDNERNPNNRNTTTTNPTPLTNEEIEMLLRYDTNRKRLSGGNLLGYRLNRSEGVGTASQTEAARLARLSSNAALSRFPNREQRGVRDAYRHFTWNQRGVQSRIVGLNDMRTISINHEWEDILKEESVIVYDTKLRELLNRGVPHEYAQGIALDYTIAQMISTKNLYIARMRSDFEFFYYTFTEDHIMDFHNNCFGRAYVNMPLETGFNTSKNRGELILDANAVTRDHYKYVYLSDWWTY